MKETLIIATLSISLILGVRSGLSSEYDDIQVLQSDFNGVTLRYSPSNLLKEEKVIENQLFHKVGIAKCPLAQSPGEPQLPMRIVMLGVPLGCEIKASVLSWDYSDLKDFNIPPVPQIEQSEDPLEDRIFYRKDENIYGQNRFLPEENILLETPRFIRDQRIVRLKIFPLQFNPVTRLLRRMDSITIRVDFVGGSKPDQGVAESQSFERVFQNILLNYQSSKNWRRSLKMDAALMKMEKKKPEDEINPFGFSDQWYKIVIGEDGIYKIGEKELKAAGVDVESLDPGEIRIFNGGGRELLLDPSAEQLQLRELPVYVRGEDDGSFEQEDYILFYGWGVNNWEYDTTQHQYDFYIHHYTTQNIYWLTLSGDFPDSAKRMEEKDGSLVEPQPFVPWKFKSRIHLEEENTLYMSSSGHYADFFNWYWEQTSSTTKYFSLRGVVPDDSAEIKVRATSSLPTITINDQKATTIQASGWITKAHTTALSSGLNKIEVDFSGNCYVDWYEVEYWREYVAYDNRLLFESPDTSGVVEYRISEITEDVMLFDISDRFAVKRVIDFSTLQDSLKFQDQLDTREKLTYFLADQDNFKSPEDILSDEKSLLRDTTSADNQADFLIITHPDFYEHLHALEEFRESYNQLKVRIVDVQEIYDEFSWGLYDPLAIREFLKFANRYWLKPSPSFCLLVGDGNYDYKRNRYSEAFNWIPPFAADRSVSDENYVYFSKYGYLDSDTTEGSLNMIIGRWPVKTMPELEAILDKVINYEEIPNFGAWRNLITLVADDEYNGGDSENIHTKDTETLGEYHVPSSFNLNKIYLMEYPFDQLNNKPAATEDIIQAYNTGSLLINWMGHGNRHQWSHEKVFRRSEDIPRLKNKDKLPLVYTASCNIALFFEPLAEAMAEDLLRAQDKGAIAVISATYLVFPGPNAALNNKVFDLLLYSDSLTVGEALYVAKLLRQPNSNDRQYILMGDPLTRLGVPEFAVNITEISSDTLTALSLLSFEGEVSDREGNPQNFNGIAKILAFDSEEKKSHQMPNGEGVPYDLPGRAIFRGNAQVVNGKFNSSFVVPKDISYGGSNARISIYICDQFTDGAGSLDSLVVYGSDTTVVDTAGPSINMTLSSQDDFRKGNGEMKIELSDSNGINLTGELGHGITLVVDGDFQHSIDLTDFFEYYQDEYQRGSVVYPLPHITKGEHSLWLKAWDNFNNSTLTEVELNLLSSEKLEISDVMNYPNPFSDSTYICYNVYGITRKIQIKIFTLSGKLVKEIVPESGETGFHSILWNGEDQNGNRVANGVYIYKVIADNESQKKTQAYGKAVVMR